VVGGVPCCVAGCWGDEIGEGSCIGWDGSSVQHTFCFFSGMIAVVIMVPTVSKHNTVRLVVIIFWFFLLIRYSSVFVHDEKHL